MAEVLAQFADTFPTTEGGRYRAQVAGAPNAHGLWEAWIEFVPIGDHPPVRSPRETTQPNRTDAEYWATGLTHVYLEGALDRALHPIQRAPPTEARALFDTPAPAAVDAIDRRVAGRSAVLDPFSVFEKGESLLRRQLSALSAWHLVNIVEAYALSPKTAAELNALSSRELAALIVERVRNTAIVR